MSFLASLRALGGSRGRLAEALAAAPGFIAPAKLVLAEVPGMGLGVVAAEPLAAGEAGSSVRSFIHSFIYALLCHTPLRTAQFASSTICATALAPLSDASSSSSTDALLSTARCSGFSRWYQGRDRTFFSRSPRTRSWPRRWRRKASKAQPSWCVFAAQVAASSMTCPSQPLHVMLALHLVFEAGNPAAAGHAYAASLPAPDAPALWPAEALAALAGTRTHGRVMARRGFVATVHQALFGDGGALPRERFAWALAVVLSRALSGTGAPYTLARACSGHSEPCRRRYGCALLRRRCRRVCGHCAAAARPRRAAVSVVRRIGAGLCNDRTLRLYGFATSRNPHDAALLPPPWPAPSADDPMRLHKAHWLSRDDVAAAAGSGTVWLSAEADASPVPVRGAGDGEALLAALRVMHAAPDDLPSLPPLPPPPLDASRPLSARNEAAARDSLARAARSALSRYPSTLEQTERALTKPDATTAAPEPAAAVRLRAALAVRAGEQRALNAVLRCAESQP